MRERLAHPYRDLDVIDARAQMIAAGYFAEGYGPDAVIMCAAA